MSSFAAATSSPIANGICIRSVFRSLFRRRKVLKFFHHTDCVWHSFIKECRYTS